ncbi:MAG TPA: 4-hydroxy-tetrahydrodipicolinate synthase [Polyangiaceae bacterium]|nr:4-hydroxy-tetrahydrodipicolinate synthase [Polyangiaceae bacterium]
MAELDLSGTFTALATPFTADGSAIDWASWEKLVQSQIDGGVAGVIPCGTTGESATLSDAEDRELVTRTVAQVRGKLKVIAGTGTNSTAHSIELTRQAFDAGADATMIVMPYYNKPSQEGLLRHVTLIAQSVPGPLVVYNIPGRSVVELSVDTLLRILDLCPNVVALKDASGNVLYCQDLLTQARDRVTVLSGDDPLTVPLMSVGAKGVISVTSNVYPRAVQELVAHALRGDFVGARERQLAMYGVNRALFSEPSPSPVKAALAARGTFTHRVLRPPLVEASPTCRGRLAEVMAAFEAGA